MNKKTLLGTLLAVFALVVTGVTFAYWANGINSADEANKGNDILIGQGETIETKVDIDGSTPVGTVLVPVGRESETSVSSVTIEFTITWNEFDDEKLLGDNNSTAEISLVASLSIADAGILKNDVLALFTVTQVDFPTSLKFGEAATFSVTVEFATEPGTKALYDAVANKTIVLNVKATMGAVTQ